MLILYEDNHVLAVEKPPGLLTQPSGTEQENLEEIAKEWIKKRDQKPGNVFLEAVHRLDKAASGIVVFAKTKKALSRLTTAIRNGKADKKYIALVEGSPPHQQDSLDHFIVHDHHKARIVPYDTPHAKRALLSYKVLKQIATNSLIEITLETGRYHQIRAQLAHIGCPIVGDHKYGCKQSHTGEGIALHHYQLTIPHPVKEETISIISDTKKFNGFN